MRFLIVSQIKTLARAVEVAHAGQGERFLVVKTPYEFQVVPEGMVWAVGPSSQIVYSTI